MCSRIKNIVPQFDAVLIGNLNAKILIINTIGVWNPFYTGRSALFSDEAGILQRPGPSRGLRKRENSCPEMCQISFTD